jgi:hypothetical protein
MRKVERGFALLTLFGFALVCGCSCSDEVQSQLESQLVSTGGLAFNHAPPNDPPMRLRDALPGLTVEGDDFGLRGALEAANVGSDGGVRITISRSGEQGEPTQVRAEIDATYAHLPEWTVVSGRVEGIVGTGSDGRGTPSADQLRTAVADAIVGALAEHRPGDAAPPTDPGPVRDVAVGNRRDCFLHEGGVVRCRFSHGTQEHTLPVPGMERAEAIEAGGSSVCALVSAGRAWCLGRGAHESVERFRATEVCDLVGARSLSVHEAHGCSIDEDGRVTCWGVPQDGECARRGPEPIVGPEGPISGATVITVGLSRACAATPDAVWCWKHGERPAAVPDTAGFEHVSTLFWMCGTTDGQTVRCIDLDGGREPFELELAAPLVAYAQMGHEWVVLLESGEVVSLNAGAAPLTLPAPEGLVTLDASLGKTCAVDGEGKAWCWTDHEHTPVAVDPLGTAQ